MFPIIQAKPQYLSDIYSMIIDLARYEGIHDKLKITESQLGNPLFCYQPNHFCRYGFNQRGAFRVGYV